jgi:endonuclease III
MVPPFSPTPIAPQDRKRAVTGNKEAERLVSVCLSTMIITPRVVKACVALFERVSTLEELLVLDDDELCRQILHNFGGRIPDTHEELMKPQGIGRKVTDTMMNFIFHEDTIAIDTHVLRGRSIPPARKLFNCTWRR